ncbi:MAG: SGNH/GDSL hydrolase family protein [Myxococcota bacterium]|nr:SGNH/GDSL hydrolase family protein [Myxococcota bacterium]
MRIAGIGYPMFWAPEPVAGARMWPNLKAWYDLEGRSFVEINSIGYRDEEHPKAKDEGEFRIALLGDSMTEALQVPFEDIYWNVARRELESCEALAGRTIVPMNFAISGFGTAQQLEVMKHKVWDYDPDMVILAFVSNDFTDNHPSFGGRDLKPFYRLDDSGQLVLDDSFRRSPVFLARISPFRSMRRELIQLSRVLQLAVEMRAEAARRSSLAAMKNRAGLFSRPPSTDASRETWKTTEAMLAHARQEVESRDRKFLLLLTTDGHQVHPDPEYRKRRIEITGAEDLFYWNNRLASFAAEQGIDHLSLAQRFVSYAEENGICLHGFENSLPCGGHWNSEGHRLAGRAISAAICAQISDT